MAAAGRARLGGPGPVQPVDRGPGRRGASRRTAPWAMRYATGRGDGISCPAPCIPQQAGPCDP